MQNKASLTTPTPIPIRIPIPIPFPIASTTTRAITIWKGQPFPVFVWFLPACKRTLRSQTSLDAVDKIGPLEKVIHPKRFQNLKP